MDKREMIAPVHALYAGDKKSVTRNFPRNPEKIPGV
jgi:hypothetical protein